MLAGVNSYYIMQQTLVHLLKSKRQVRLDQLTEMVMPPLLITDSFHQHFSPPEFEKEPIHMSPEPLVPDLNPNCPSEEKYYPLNQWHQELLQPISSVRNISKT